MYFLIIRLVKQKHEITANQNPVSYKGGVTGGPFLAFRGKFYGIRLFVAFVFCFPGFNTSLFRFSAELVPFFVLFRLSAIIYNAPSLSTFVDHPVSTQHSHAFVYL